MPPCGFGKCVCLLSQFHISLVTGSVHPAMLCLFSRQIAVAINQAVVTRSVKYSKLLNFSTRSSPIYRGSRERSLLLPPPAGKVYIPNPKKSSENALGTSLPKNSLSTFPFHIPKSISSHVDYYGNRQRVVAFLHHSHHLFYRAL